MYDIDFISEVGYCVKYGINPAALALGIIATRAMVYDDVERKIHIVNLLGMSESRIYWGLCHELLHAVLHVVMGKEVCFALDKITEFERTPDGKNAFIWIGDDPEKASI
jgi:hypothetical protein